MERQSSQRIPARGRFLLFSTMPLSFEKVKETASFALGRRKRYQ
jgi:hypothetical protein